MSKRDGKKSKLPQTEYERAVLKALDKALPGFESKDEILPFLDSKLAFLNGMIFREDEAEMGSNWYCFITNKKGDWLINIWDRDPIYSLLDLIEIKTAPDMISMYGTGYSENYEDRVKFSVKLDGKPEGRIQMARIFQFQSDESCFDACSEIDFEDTGYLKEFVLHFNEDTDMKMWRKDLFTWYHNAEKLELVDGVWPSLKSFGSAQVPPCKRKSQIEEHEVEDAPNEENNKKKEKRIGT